jgi:hypothetical protein
MRYAAIVTILTPNYPESEACSTTEETSKTHMVTKKKTAKKSPCVKAAKVALSLTREELRELPRHTELELTICVTVEDTYESFIEVQDSGGDGLSVPYANITHARIMPKAKVKVSGEGAERAAQILRDKGFDIG